MSINEFPNTPLKSKMLPETSLILMVVASILAKNVLIGRDKKKKLKMYQCIPGLEDKIKYYKLYLLFTGGTLINSYWFLGGGVILRCLSGEKLRLKAIDLSGFTSKLHVLNFFFLKARFPLLLFSGIMLLVLLKNLIFAKIIIIIFSESVRYIEKIYLEKIL